MSTSANREEMESDSSERELFPTHLPSDLDSPSTSKIVSYLLKNRYFVPAYYSPYVSIFLLLHLSVWIAWNFFSSLNYLSSLRIRLVELLIWQPEEHIFLGISAILAVLFYVVFAIYVLPEADLLGKEDIKDFLSHFHELNLAHYPTLSRTATVVWIFGFLCTNAVSLSIIPFIRTFQMLQVFSFGYYYVNVALRKTNVLSHLFKLHRDIMVYTCLFELVFGLEEWWMVALKSLIFVFETGKHQKGRIHVFFVVIFVCCKLYMLLFLPDHKKPTRVVFALIFIGFVFMCSNAYARYLFRQAKYNLVQWAKSEHCHHWDYAVKVNHVTHYYNTVFYMRGGNVVCELCFLAELILFVI